MKISDLPARLASVPMSQLRTVAFVFVGISALMGLLVGDVTKIMGYSLLSLYLWKSTRFHDLVLYLSTLSILYGMVSIFADANYFWGFFQIIGSLTLVLYASRHKAGKA